MAISTSKKDWESAATNATAWKEIAGIPGAADMLASNPDLFQQVAADPQGALDTYYSALEESTAAGDGTAEDSPYTVDMNVDTSMQDPAAFGLNPQAFAAADQAYNDAMSGVEPGIEAMEGLAPKIEAYAPQIQRQAEAISGSADTLGKMISDMAQINAARMRGELPADVTLAVRQASAEKAAATGQGGGQAARNLVARDLGLTSLQLQEAGLATGVQLAGLTGQQAQMFGAAGETYGRAASTLQAGAQVRESATNQRTQLAQLAQRTREFDRSFALETQAFMDTIRKTDLDEAQLNAQIQEFNAQQNLKILEFVNDLFIEQTRAMVDLAKEDIDDANMVAGYTDFINEMTSQISSTGTV